MAQRLAEEGDSEVHNDPAQHPTTSAYQEQRRDPGDDDPG